MAKSIHYKSSIILRKIINNNYFKVFLGIVLR